MYDLIHEDLDGDGWCDGMERANGWNESDPCSPMGMDSDQDGLCDMEELLSGWDPEDPCSPNATDVDGDGLCDLLEEINGSYPNSAESTLDIDDLAESDASIQWTQSGFQVLCETCMGGQWVLLDLAGRAVTTGRIASHNDLTVPAGSYVLSVPELGLHEVCPLQR